MVDCVDGGVDDFDVDVAVDDDDDDDGHDGHDGHDGGHDGGHDVLYIHDAL